MSARLIETTVGALIIGAIFAMFILAFKVSGLTNYNHSNSYEITAVFDNIGDLKPRAAVTVAGVKVGQVESIRLNDKDYKAMVHMRIAANNNNIPADSQASIVTAGLLGANYVALTPGFDEDFLKNGSQIQDTHPAILLEEMIGQLLFNMKGDAKKDAGATAAKTNA